MARHKIVASQTDWGELGIKIKGNNRDYFDPASNGVVLAHDLLEHTTKPHWNGFADELMALGAIVAGRIKTGWCNNVFGISLTTDDLAVDVFRVIESCEDLPPCSSTIRDTDDLDAMKKAILMGIEEAKEQDYIIPDKDSILGWMCKGHQIFRSRFSHLDLYTVTNDLFDQIAIKADNWLDDAVEGSEAILHLDLTNYSVEIINPFD